MEMHLEYDQDSGEWRLFDKDPDIHGDEGYDSVNGAKLLATRLEYKSIKDLMDTMRCDL